MAYLCGWSRRASWAKAVLAVVSGLLAVSLVQAGRGMAVVGLSLGIASYLQTRFGRRPSSAHSRGKDDMATDRQTTHRDRARRGGSLDRGGSEIGSEMVEDAAAEQRRARERYALRFTAVLVAGGLSSITSDTA